MAKHLKRKEWINFFKKVENDAFDWANYLKTRKISGTKDSISTANCYFWIKYKTWKKIIMVLWKNKLKNMEENEKR